MTSKSETKISDKFYNDLESIVLPFDIHTAASLGDVAYFLKFHSGKLKTQISIPNSSGWTPLMYSCARGHSLLANYLLSSGARRRCTTKSGVTPLMLAISSGDISTVETVFHSENLEEKDYRNWTPLFYAVHFTREKCLNFLLSRGADVNIVDYQNETPLMVAIKGGRETIVQLLLRTTKNFHVVSFKQESAPMLANESTNQRIQAMVNSRLSELKKGDVQSMTPVTTLEFATPRQHCSPTPLKHQIKAHLSHMKMSKSLSYSPNQRAAIRSPARPDVSPLKYLLRKKCRSSQLKHHDDVEAFLKSLGLEKYWPIFRDEEVDYETLLTFNEDNLKELGIRAMASSCLRGSRPFVTPAHLFIHSFP